MASPRASAGAARGRYTQGKTRRVGKQRRACEHCGGEEVPRAQARAARRAARVVAWKPVLIPATDRVEPHDEQVMKNRRLSLVRVVSGDLHVLHCEGGTRST